MDYQAIGAQQEAAKLREFLAELLSKIDALTAQVKSLESKLDAPAKKAKD